MWCSTPLTGAVSSGCTLVRIYSAPQAILAAIVVVMAVEGAIGCETQRSGSRVCPIAYPPDPGRVVVKTICVSVRGPHTYLPSRHKRRADPASRGTGMRTSISRSTTKTV
jgi:hypothetical protein